ncbi:23S rRNA (pseudouridine(1915)-N(3))-methyltransferase RlmH, partial [Acetobacter okinawensis]|uniref:23S rRNA (pseudouridine(1915)-N(3))-methyltransferase RlmH n=1 Tax=Acetobacter okinawensis TaxID=1076594 RepID=UPI002011D9F6
MRLVAVGRMKDKSERALVERYLKRLRPALDIVELPDGRGSPDEIKRREAQAILAACPAQSHVVALDEGGRTYSSVAFATGRFHARGPVGVEQLTTFRYEVIG